MRDFIDVEWMLIAARVNLSPRGWAGWVVVGPHEWVPTPGSTSTTEIQNPPPVEDGE